MRGRTNVSGQGVVLNATTANCIVETGNTIVAGDFVQTSYHPTEESTTFAGKLVSNGWITKLVELDNKNLLVTYSYNQTSSSADKIQTYYEVYDKESLQKLSEGSFANDTSASNNLYSPQLINIGNNKIALVSLLYYSSVYFTVIILEYNPTTHNISVLDRARFNGNGTVNNYLDAILYDSNKLVIWAKNVLVLFDITTMQELDRITTTPETVSGVSGGANDKMYASPIIHNCSNGRFIIFSYYQVELFKIENNELISLYYSSTLPTELGEYFGIGKISDTEFFGFNRYFSSGSGHTTKTYVKYIVNQDDTVTISAETSSETYKTEQRTAFNINNGNAILTAMSGTGVYIAKMSSDMQSIIPTYELIYTLSGSVTTAQVVAQWIQWLTADTFRLLIRRSIQSAITALNCVVANNEISASASTTYVKQYQTRCNGVAKTAGTAGDTIQVYIPIASN